MRRFVRAALAATLAIGLLGACSAEGGIDTSGDGVKIEGDVDAKNPLIALLLRRILLGMLGRYVWKQARREPVLT